MNVLSRHIEALIFCASEPISIDELQQTLDQMFDADFAQKSILQSVDLLCEKYNKDEFAFRIETLAGRYQFLTKPAYQASISMLLKQKSKKRLSTSALETLSIVAYKQPITKSEVEMIRGVNCDYAIQRLLEKELLDIKGKSDAVGRPILYGTSTKFMAYFGIKSLDDLPTLKDISSDQNEIGEPIDEQDIQLIK